ncbi:NAD(P)/FAD-dependent oxidoreductase [Oceaniovalibus sp. ACAM 378]|uniref:NAD(P)/FAD-dependent oxidoreductase n=1 Tax=Oceaniovalibus sp. ACAM 378 TaxID=2599923 RepID=UPI0011D4BB82|nr:NAD(P)/FAD-dependent oxidoreductase [Oceaniovalibus sp. ACAM 378]TYB89531.1 NAD(P)/FAD-dependent oxidoreductase [Oceaniovalibus sp. ACAM 378]
MTDARKVVIIGAGPAGSTLALRLARKGIRTVIIEKSAFPREHIGESLSGECGVMLRELGFQDQLDRLDFPVKRGVSVYGPNGRGAFWVPVGEPGPDGTLIEGTTWQVRRPEFDTMLLRAAQDAGCEVIQAAARAVLRDDAGLPTGVTLRFDDGRTDTLDADFLVDASGLAGFLSKAGVAGPRERGSYSKQVAFYAQFENVRRDPAPHDGNTHIFYQRKHHWAWMIPISRTKTSVGIVVPGASYRASGQNPEDFLTARLADLNDEFSRRMADARRISAVWSTSNYSHKISGFTGPRHLCLGDAHRFSDPIFSFGVSNALKEAALAAPAIEAALALDPSDAAPVMRAFESLVTGGQDRVETLINTFWEYPLAFLKLAHFDRPSDIAELFSGRIYDPSADQLPAMQMMYGLMHHAATAERASA